MTTLMIRVETDEYIFEEHGIDFRTSSRPHTNPDSFTLAQLYARVHRKTMRTPLGGDLRQNKKEESE